MENCTDDLDINPFYKILLTKFASLYQSGQRRGSVICVPLSVSLPQVTDINQEFIETHILKPSPFFKGQYVTSERSNPRTLTLEDEVFTTCSGFPKYSEIKVLSEELGYNKDSKPFRILIIERPFVSTNSTVSQKDEVSLSSDLYNLEPSYTQCMKYLEQFPESAKALAQLSEEATALRDNYMIVSGYLGEVGHKLRTVGLKLTQVYMKGTTSVDVRDSRIHSNIEKCVESQLLASIHPKLFPVVTQDQASEDRYYTARLSRLRPLGPSCLGVRPEHCCPLLDAVKEMSKIVSCRTPLEMLLCIKKTFDSITQTISDHLARSEALTIKAGKSAVQTGSPELLLTSDDYIPLLLHVLAQVDTIPVASVTFYVDNFHWASSQTDQISFTYVTFQAVVHYLKTLDVDKLVLEEEHRSKKLKPPEKPPELTNVSPAAPLSRKDKHLLKMERITKMLDSATKEFDIANKDFTPPPFNHKAALMNKTRANKASQLGDFLASLDDDCAPDFGKQT